MAEFWRAAHADGDGRCRSAVRGAAGAGADRRADRCDEVLVDAAHRAGLAVHVWTIDDAGEMRQLIDLRVDGIMSDVPSVLVSVLAERGVRYLG